MLSDAERAEHRALRERAWGRSADRVLSDADRARLAQLDRRAGGAPEPPPAAPAPPTPVQDPRVSGGDPASGGSDAAIRPSPTPISSRGNARVRARRPRRRGAIIAATIVAILCAAAAGWVGGSLSGRSASAGGSSVPLELVRGATDEDRLDAAGLAIDPESARFVARVDGIDVYIARGEEAGLICIATVSPATGPSAACGNWSPRDGGLAAQVTPGLTLTLGAPMGVDADSDVLQLSDSVWAVRSADPSPEASSG
ncbi:hypothetical protein ACIQLJ_04030 [Microbacterium sp. NPDC091313]